MELQAANQPEKMGKVLCGTFLLTIGGGMLVSALLLLAGNREKSDSLGETNGL